MPESTFDMAEKDTIFGFFEKLFKDDFMPHGHCYFWKPEIVWLHVLSDLLIAASYYSIPLMLLYFIKKRKDVPFHRLFFLFAAFIFWCGTSHVMNVVTLWVPVYRLEGLVKAVTAVISVYTASVLFPVIPQALTLKSSKELEDSNLALEKEIAENKRIQEKLFDSEKKLRAIFEAVPSGIITVDSKGSIVEYNGGAQNLFGYGPDEMAGKSLTTLMPESFQQLKTGKTLELIGKKKRWDRIPR